MTIQTTDQIAAELATQLQQRFGDEWIVSIYSQQNWDVSFLIQRGAFKRITRSFDITAVDRTRILDDVLLAYARESA